MMPFPPHTPLPSHGLCLMGREAAEGYLSKRRHVLVQEAKMGCERFTYARQLHDRSALFWVAPVWLAQAALRLPVACTPHRSHTGLLLRSRLDKGVLGSSLAMSHRLCAQVAFCEDAVRAHGAVWLLPSIEEADIEGAWGQAAVADWRMYVLKTRAANAASGLAANWPAGCQAEPMVRF